MVKPRNLIMGIVLAVGLMVTPPLYHFSKGNLLASPIPPKEKTDAVMVFTGSAERIIQGYNLYLKGKSDRVMISGYDYPEEASQPMIKKLARKIKKNKIFIDLKARNTIENAENGAEWAIKNHVKSILLVTAEGHMPRAYFELRRLLPESVKIYTQAVPGDVNSEGVDTESRRLICRLYETATGTSFCYKTRDLISHLVL